MSPWYIPPAHKRASEQNRARPEEQKVPAGQEQQPTLAESLLRSRCDWGRKPGQNWDVDSLSPVMNSLKLTSPSWFWSSSLKRRADKVEV